MGYTTDFTGSLNLILKNGQLEYKDISDETFSKDLVTTTNSLVTNGKTIIDDINPIKALQFVNLLSQTRRMKRDISKIEGLNPEYFGIEGEFYIPIHDLQHFGQSRDSSVIDSNTPPKTQPGLWCKWIVSQIDENTFILEWDGNEKFYYYTEWLDYIIQKIFIPKGIVANGEIEWKGEESGDTGTITVCDNIIAINES